MTIAASGAPLPQVGPPRAAALRRRVRLIVAATISYNLVEAVVAITAGTIASSSALIGFGLDSTVEVISAAAIAWQFAGSDHAARERVALRVVAVSFFALAAYVTVQAVRSLAASAPRPQLDRHHSGRGKPGRDAVPVLGGAANGSRARFSQRGG